ncbi:pectin lyase-like protein, partial [Aspergillus novofumigatus IBT 16806]
MWISLSATLSWVYILSYFVLILSSSHAHWDHAAHHQAFISPRGEAAVLPPNVAAHNATSSQIATAHQIVREAVAEMTKRNQARLAHPSRNNYSMKPGTKLGKHDNMAAPPPLLNITNQIARAAALVAKLKAGGLAVETTPSYTRGREHSGWRGLSKRVPSWLIPQVKDGDGPDGNALEWYINTARFYSQIRNLKIDITASNPGAYMVALHYQVAQATTIKNVKIITDSAMSRLTILPDRLSKACTQRMVAGRHVRHHFHQQQLQDLSQSLLIQQTDYDQEPSLLGPSVAGLDVAPYFERPRNQYADKTAVDFVHLKDEGAAGDGSTDDTDAVQNAFNKYGDGSKIILVDAGTYIIKRTVTVPKNVKIIDETWSQFAASGGYFGDASKPAVMLRVGNEGEVGNVELQDLILTSKGPTPGVILMEWNVAAESAGSAALWDVHRASGYFDNMWLWVADHMIDDPLLDDPLNNMEQLSVYSARGMLIESQKATWLVFYQYNFNGAQNIFTTFLQTESPYYQPTPKPPAPFDQVVGTFDSDPKYGCDGSDADGCDASWAVIMKNCQNVHIGSAGTYSWFRTYTQDCIDVHGCQKALWLLGSNYDNNRLQHVIGTGAKNIIVSPDGTTITSAANLAVSSHPSWAHISLYELPSIGAAPKPGDGGDDQCSNAARQYSSEYVPPGEIELWSNDGTVLNHADDTDVLDLAVWRRALGRALKNNVTYDLGLKVGSFVDTNGYERRVVFDLGGMGLGWRELGFPGERVSVALVISGSEEYGYVTSLQLNNADWMNRMYAIIKDRELRHVVVP